jgi:hypothetical protein
MAIVIPVNRRRAIFSAMLSTIALAKEGELLSFSLAPCALRPAPFFYLDTQKQLPDYTPIHVLF